ncbi:MAG: helix-hairpin-helix domain-containing protein [Candidatus Competibacter sp.]|nr:helix-hairpin-helix domain-containing protein [Candidatus Competibacter sp.]
MRFINIILAFALLLFSVVTFAQTVDINTATAEQLEKSLKGIGPAKAADIVKYREANGPFKSVDELTKVPGIKEKGLQKLLADNPGMLTVGGAAAAPAVPTAPAMPAMPTTPKAPAMPAMPTTPKAPTVPTTPPPPKQ